MWCSIKARNFEPKTEKEAQSAVDFLNKSHYVVTDLETKPTGSKPRAPIYYFNLTTNCKHAFRFWGEENY